MKVLFTFIVACGALILGGCGYHLRGAYELPPQMATTYIKANNTRSELVRGLKRSLETSGVYVVETKTEAGAAGDSQPHVAVLHILLEKSNKRVLSVDANGSVREYELTYEIAFDLTRSDGFSVPEQKLYLTRDFLFDPQDVLGKSGEEADLMRDMQQDMVRLIMLRLQAVAQKNNSAVKPLPVP